MVLYAATLFLPSPAVPHVRLSLFLATRWKPLPPRHLCDTQAHQSPLFAPVPRGPSLRGVILSPSIIARTTPSASLIDSSRFQFLTLIRAVFVILWIVPDCLADLPQFTLRFLLYMPSSVPRRAALLLLSVASQDLSVFAHNAEARHLLHYSGHLPPVTRRVAHLPRLQCSLYATACIVARPTGMTTCAFARSRVLLLPSLPMVGRPPTSRL